MVNIPISQGYYISPAAPLVDMTCTNLYPQYPQTTTPLNEGALFRTPGIEAIKDSGVTGVGRGSHKYQKRQWAFHVTGNSLIVRKSLYTVKVIGTITGSGQVSMADNGVVLCIIVPGVAGYFYNIDTEVLTQITNPIFLDFMSQEGGVTSVVEHNNRFIYTTDEEFFLGSLVTTNSGTDFDALDFEDAESANDPIVRVMEAGNELYVFNTETIEVYKDIGGTDFPYQRIPGATIDTGLTARFGIARNGESFFYLGRGESDRPAILQTLSGRSAVVSTPAIDALIQSYSDDELSEVVAWTYSADGSSFIGFNLPNKTIVLDVVATKRVGLPIWHIRATNNSKWRVNSCLSIFGTIMVEDNLDSRCGALSRNYVTEYGVAIDREFTTMYLDNNSNSFIARKAELYCTTGLGAAFNDPPPETYNPSIELLFSVDQGNTFYSLGTTTFGNVGEYTKRQVWRRVGRASQTMLLKFKTSAKVPLDILKLTLDLK